MRDKVNTVFSLSIAFALASLTDSRLSCCVQLLGLESNDIDIALEDMMGLTFAEKLQTYCKSVKDIPIAKIAKVERNPDRSKHLETAKATVLDVEIDFVNLRSEEYAGDSRIPTQVVSKSH